MAETNLRGKILLVDDEELILDIVADILTSGGYMVVCATNSNVAIHEYEKSLAEGSPFDAVLLDLAIPGGLSGLATLKKLLEIDPNVKAIVSSGDLGAPELVNPLKYGFSGKLVKPFKMDDLLGVVSAIVG